MLGSSVERSESVNDDMKEIVRKLAEVFDNDKVQVVGICFF